jgi:hypothetical protein
MSTELSWLHVSINSAKYATEDGTLKEDFYNPGFKTPGNREHFYIFN